MKETAPGNTYQTISQAAEPPIQGMILITKISCKIHRAVVVCGFHYVARQGHIGTPSKRSPARVQAIRQHVSR